VDVLLEVERLEQKQQEFKQELTGVQQNWLPRHSDRAVEGQQIQGNHSFGQDKSEGRFFHAAYAGRQQLGRESGQTWQGTTHQGCFNGVVADLPAFRADVLRLSAASQIATNGLCECEGEEMLGEAGEGRYSHPWQQQRQSKWGSSGVEPEGAELVRVLNSM
jgi:hypothetical protein